MTNMNHFRSYRNLIARLAETGPEPSKLTLDHYDHCLSDFLKVAKAAKGIGQTDKMMWHLMRAGIRAEINAFHSKARAKLKAPPKLTPAEQAEKRRRFLQVRKEADERRAKERADWKAFNDSLPTQAQIIETARVAIEKQIEDEANKRAVLILSTWVCDGVPLGQCTGLDLDRFEQKERATAAGHLNNAAFYAALREHTPDDKSVVDAVSPTVLVGAFDTVFSASESSNLVGA